MAGEPTPRSLRSRLLTAAKVVFGLVLVYFIYRALATGFTTSGFSKLSFSWPHLVASWVALLGYYAVFVGGLALVFRALGVPTSYRDTFKLSFSANLGKYLPGGFWPVAGRVSMGPKAGVPRRVALVSTIVESAVSVTGGTLLFLLAVALGAPVPGSLPTWPFAVLAAGIVVALHPALFGRLIALGMRLAKVEGEAPRLTFPATLGLVVYYMGVWTVSGVALWTFTRSLVPDTGAGPLVYGPYYAAAAVMGLLVLFVPGGIGVREGMLLFLLSPLIGRPQAAVVSVAARVWTTLLELVCSSIALALPYLHEGLEGPEDAEALRDDAEGPAAGDAEAT